MSLDPIGFLSFNNDEVQKMLDFAFEKLGDNDYDDVVNHHGSGENRALAFRSGLAFGRSKGQYKDNYYKMFLESLLALKYAPSTLLLINQSPHTAIFSL